MVTITKAMDKIKRDRRQQDVYIKPNNPYNKQYEQDNNAHGNRASSYMASPTQLDKFKGKQSYNRTESYVNDCFSMNDGDVTLDNTISAVADDA